VTIGQLRRLGVRDGAIARRLRIGRLHVLHRGVYAVGHVEISREGRFLAAVLAAGDRAVLSHRSAAAHWGFAGAEGEEIDVAVPCCRRQRSGLHLHVVRSLPAADSTRHRGIPVTTPARTLLDLADVLPDRALERAVHEAEVQRRVNHRQLRAQLERASGRRGAGRLESTIAAGPAPTRSELEDRLLALLESHSLPRPRANARVGAFEVDFFFPAHGLVVEADGDRYHGTAAARRRDATRQATWEAAGLRVLRVTWEQVTRAETQTAARLRRALAPAESGQGV
jgi:very-short-patch-repair endonuclease